MKLKHYAYLFLGPKLDPKEHRAVIKNPIYQLTIIGMDFAHKDQSVPIAKELYAEGVQMIELCGGFGPIWIAKISEALEGKIPVGSVAYGPEARQPLLDLLRNE